MDKAIISLVGGASALALIGQAQASTPLGETGVSPPARSYAELLEPIPNASQLLKAENEHNAADGTLELAQYNYHHHHHHHHYRRYHHHHHHHHHHRHYNY